MIGRTNAKRGGSGNVTTVTLTPATQGATVTASRTGKTKTAVTDANGVATFKNLDMGYEWTFSWSTFSKTEKIDQLTESITLGSEIYEIYAQCYQGYNTDVTVKDSNNTTIATYVIPPGTSGTVKIGDLAMIPNQTYTLHASCSGIMWMYIYIYKDSNGSWSEIANNTAGTSGSVGLDCSFTPDDSTTKFKIDIGDFD